MRSDNYYLRRIKSSLSYGRTTYDTVKALFVENLSSMGVDCSTDDGMTTLANKIKDIEPTIVIDDLEIVCSLECETSTVSLGDNVVLTATLEAIYDSTSVDLKGKLQNATLKFYEGNYLVGSSTTDVNGVATVIDIPPDLGTHTYHCVFEGTEIFDSDTSNNVTVTVEGAKDTVVLVNRRSGGYEVIDAYITLNGETKRCYSEEYGRVEFNNVPDGEYEVTAYYYETEYYPKTIEVDWEHREFELLWDIK